MSNENPATLRHLEWAWGWAAVMTGAFSVLSACVSKAEWMPRRSERPHTAEEELEIETGSLEPT